MKVLIIGGTSSLGIILKNILLQNHEVITAGRVDCDIYMDLSVDQNIDIKVKCDVVVLTAAVFGGENIDAYINNINVNVVGTVRAVSLAQKINAKHFILISSMSIFQERNKKINKIYVITKRQSEEIAEFTCNSIGMPLTILRPSQLYSDLQSLKQHQPFLYNIVSRASKNEKIILHGCGNSKRNYLHTKDFVEIINKVIDHNIFGNFNCVNTRQQTVVDIVEAVINAFESTSKIYYDKTKENIIDFPFKPDLDFYNQIDFTPNIDIQKGMSMIANLNSNLK
jgi:nucleoside-diphosphate-sugar epimerase